MNGLNRIVLLMSVSIVIACMSNTHAAELGDPAAKLNIEEWVKGDPVDFEKGNDKTIYVVEFWATWCGPCRTSIPHLTKLQEKYKDKVVFIGISDEPVETVAPYVEKMGKKMGYTVALDTSRKTHNGYMKAYAQGGIPTAFIVDQKGKVAWLGHPMGNLDKVLSQVIAGTYDIDLARREMNAERDLPEYFKLVLAGESSEARVLGERIAKDGSANAGLLNEFAWTILTEPGLRNRDLNLAMSVAQAAYDASEGISAMITDTYARAYYELGDFENAVKYQREAISLTEDKRLLRELKMTLAQYEKEKH